MFLDSKGVPQSAKSASVASNSNQPIIKATDYFNSVIDTKDFTKDTREVR